MDWEVAGIVDEPRDKLGRSKASDHKVLGLGSTARLKVLPERRHARYARTDYCRPVRAAARQRRTCAFFDTGGKVRGDAQGTVHLLRDWRRFRRPAARERPDQTAFRPEHVERPNHLRPISFGSHRERSEAARGLANCTEAHGG